MNRQTPTQPSGTYRSIMVLIPAYNAGESIARVVKEVALLGPDLTTLVIDDGSTDMTAKNAREAGALVRSHSRNMGKGAALRTGFEHFLKTDLKAIVTLDADGQHSPDEIPKLIDRWLVTKADIIIGTRKRDVTRMPLLRVMTNTLSSFLVSLSSGKYIHDSQSGFRLLSRRVIENVKTSSRGYGAESEILIKAVSRGFTIEAAAVSTIYAGEKSYVHPLKQPLLFMGLIIKSIFWRFERVGREQSK